MKTTRNSTVHTYESNRLEMPDTSINGTVTTSVKNCKSVLDIESEIYNKLKANGGDRAVFTYWIDGDCYITIYLLSFLESYKKHFTNN